MKIKLIAILFSLIFAGLFASMVMYGKKQYRYECQDPAKYHLPMCQPPLCEVSGICTDYLIGEVETVPTTLPTKEIK